MPEELLAGVKLSVIHLGIFACKVLAQASAKTCKGLDTMADYSVLLRFLSYENFCIMFKYVQKFGDDTSLPR